MKKCSKKIIFIIFLLCITSCNQNKQLNRKNQFIIWASYTGERDKAFKIIVNNFKKKYLNSKISPEIKIYNPSFINVHKKLVVAAQTGNLPDLVRVNTSDVTYLAQGNFASKLDKYNVKEILKDLHPVASTVNKISNINNNQSHNYAVIDQITCLLLFYNKDLFEKANIKQPPKTLDEFVKYGKLLTNKKKNIYGCGINASLWWTLPWIYVHGGNIIVDNENCSLNTKEIVEALTFLQNLSVLHKIEGAAWRSGAMPANSGFVNKKYAMVLSGPWDFKYFSRINYGVALIPGIKNIRSQTNMGGSSYIILKNSQHKDLAFKFLKYLVSYESQKIWTKITGEISINQKVNINLKKEFSQEQLIMLEQFKYIKHYPQTPYFSELENIFKDYLYLIFDGKIKVSKALEEICLKFNKNKK